jgi:hypothetical protein
VVEEFVGVLLAAPSVVVGVLLAPPDVLVVAAVVGLLFGVVALAIVGVGKNAAPVEPVAPMVAVLSPHAVNKTKKIENTNIKKKFKYFKPPRSNISCLALSKKPKPALGLIGGNATTLIRHSFDIYQPKMVILHNPFSTFGSRLYSIFNPAQKNLI